MKIEGTIKTRRCRTVQYRHGCKEQELGKEKDEREIFTPRPHTTPRIPLGYILLYYNAIVLDLHLSKIIFSLQNIHILQLASNSLFLSLQYL